MSFVIYSCKTGKYLNKNFLQEVDQESGGWNSNCQILILPLWLVTPPCFLKLSQIFLKSNGIFPEKGKGNKDFILAYLDSSMADVVMHYCLFFFILTIFRRKGGLKNGPEVLTLGQSLSYKYLNPSKNFPSNSVFVC